MLLAKFRNLFASKKAGVTIGSLTLSEQELYLNTLITGGLGSGKNAALAQPLLAGLLKHFSSEKLGGVVLDARPDSTENLIYHMVSAGRNPLFELVILSPQESYPFVEFTDPSTGHHFFVSAHGEFPSSNELMQLLPEFPNMPRNDSQLGAWLNDQLGGRTLDVGVNKRPAYLGWRYEGAKLRRVTHTNALKEEQFAADAQGNAIYTDPPKRLLYERLHWVKRNITLNLFPERLGPAALASHIIGLLGAVEEPYDTLIREYLGHCVIMHRALHPERAFTVTDLLRLSHRSTLLTETRLLQQLINAQKLRPDTANPDLPDTLKYFDKTLTEHPTLARQAIYQKLFDALTPLALEAQVARTFCQDSTLNLAEGLDSGVIYTLNIPQQSHAFIPVARMLKQEVQDLALTKVTSKGTQRPVLLFCNDIPAVFTPSDPDKLSLSRVAKIIAIFTLQSDSALVSAIGGRHTPLFLHNHRNRFWFCCQDDFTNRNASAVIGKKKPLKPDGTSTWLVPTEDFTTLKPNTCIASVDSGRGKLPTERARRLQLQPLEVDAPKRANAVRWYLQATIENLLFAQELSHQLDHIPRPLQPLTAFSFVT